MAGHEDRLPVALRAAHELHEALLHDRVESHRRLVQDQQLRLVHERLHDPDLLAIPLRQAADARPEVQLEPRRELVDAASGDTAAQVAEVAKQLPSRLPAVNDEVAGQVADAGTQRGATEPWALAEHGHRSPARADQVEQDPDRGRLAGTVGPKETVDLAGLDLEIQPVEPATTTVELAEALGPDDIGHASVTLPHHPFSGR